MRLISPERIPRDEDGIALVVAITVLFAVLALAAVAVASAIVATNQSARDRSAKQAIAAADAGLGVGVYRLNKFATTLDAAQECVTVDPGSGDLGKAPIQPDGWCPAQTEDLGGGSSFSYVVSAPFRVTAAGQDVWQRKVVSTGAVRGIERRAAVTVNAPTGTALFADAVFSEEDLSMRNSSLIVGNVRSNGNIITQNSSQVCGHATFGPGKEFRGDGLCAGYNAQPATEPWVLSPVVLPASNDNDRIGTLDPWTDSGNVEWDPSTRVLRLRQGSTLTLTGSTYVFCSVILENSARIITPDDGTPVQIYIDSPENCGGVTTAFGTYQSSTIQNDSANPKMMQLYVVGSESAPSDVELRNSAELRMTIYAPHSIVTFDNYTKLYGAIAARRVVVNNNLEIQWDPRVSTLYVGDVPLPVYQRQSWVECASAPTGISPDSGC